MSLLCHSCTGPSKPLYVSNHMVIPLDTNAEDCVGARRPDEDISKFFSDFTIVSFAVFCSETNIPYCEASLRGTNVTQNCSTFVGSVRRRRQTNSEVEIAITLEIRTNLTKEDFQSFLESMRMQILNSGARRVPVSGSYTAQLTDDNIAGIVVGQKFTFACNQGYSKFHEDVCGEYFDQGSSLQLLQMFYFSYSYLMYTVLWLMGAGVLL